MCGINAVFDRTGEVLDKAVRVQAMNSQMAYRGPDDEGLYVEENVVLGMRRLSIIDVGGGHQPLFNEDRSLAVVCNGEIYNFVELREELEKKGHRFSSKSDSEIILHLYEELDTGCLEKLRGMFGFVLWDQRKQRLFAARDRIGIKPLYYAEQNGVLWFSSELKAIVRGAGISPTLNPAAVWQFLHYGFPIDQRNTMVREIKRVLPGEFILADLDSTRHQRYWELHYGQMPGKAPADEELLDTLTEAVRIHLRSDVPVGLLLSGGLDSAAIGALAARSGGNFTGICVGYADSFKFDERAAARRTAGEHGLRFRETVLDTMDFASEFNDLVAFCDEPIADPSAVSEWAVYRAASSLGFKVLLSGIGGDELFFGYDQPWNALGEQWGLNGRGNADSISEASPIYSQCHWLLDQLSKPGFQAVGSESDSLLETYTNGISPGPDQVYSVLFHAYLGLNCLLLSDKLSMGRSLELRVPLVDHRLVEAVMRVPLERRFSATETKPLLRRMLKDVLSRRIFETPKTGFNAPTGYLRSLVRDESDEIAEGELTSNFLDRQALAGLIPNRRTDGFLGNRVVNPLRRRVFSKLRAIGADGWALHLAGARSTQFLYHVLVFERWWKQMAAASHAPRQTSAEIALPYP